VQIRHTISYFVGDEVTSLKFLRQLTDELETPHVVSYFREINAGRIERLNGLDAQIRHAGIKARGVGNEKREEKPRLADSLLATAASRAEMNEGG